MSVCIWSTTELSGNTHKRALRNAVLEGVVERGEVREEYDRSLSFEAASFDVVSMLCLYTIEERRADALAARARVLRAGGTVIVSDLAASEEVVRAFKTLGFVVEQGGIEWGRSRFRASLSLANRLVECASRAQ